MNLKEYLMLVYLNVGERVFNGHQWFIEYQDEGERKLWQETMEKQLILATGINAGEVYITPKGLEFIKNG